MTQQPSHPAIADADQRLAAGQLLSVDLAARAARAANLLGHHHCAVTYTDPAANDEHTIVAPLERGFALTEIGDGDGVMKVFASLDPDRLTDDELLPYLLVAALLPDEDEGARRMERAVAAGDPDQLRRRQTVRTLAELTLRSSRSGDPRLAQQVRALTFSGELSPGNRAVAFVTLSNVLRQSAQPAQALESATFAVEIVTGHSDVVSGFHLDLAREAHVVSLVLALDLDTASQALREYSAGAFVSAANGRLSSALETYVAMGRGDLSQALASSQQFLTGIGDHDPHQVRGWVEAMTAECLVHEGRVDEARTMLDQAKQHPSSLPRVDLVRRTMTAITHDTLAEPEIALEILADVIDEARRRRLLLAQIGAAAASVLVGGPPLAGWLLDAVDHLVDPQGTPLFWQAFARAVRDYDIPAIVQLIDELAAMGARLFAARLAQFVLDMARRAGDLTPETRARLTALADLSGSGR